MFGILILNANQMLVSVLHFSPFLSFMSSSVRKCHYIGRIKNRQYYWTVGANLIMRFGMAIKFLFMCQL